LRRAAPEVGQADARVEQRPQHHVARGAAEAIDVDGAPHFSRQPTPATLARTPVHTLVMYGYVSRTLEEPPMTVDPIAPNRPTSNGHAPETGTWTAKRGLAQMLKGRLIMDVVTDDHAAIAGGA